MVPLEAVQVPEQHSVVLPAVVHCAPAATQVVAAVVAADVVVVVQVELATAEHT